MKQTLKKILAWIAKKVIETHNPFVIAITGSVGKTSARRAIYFALRQNLDIYTTQKNFNTEIGLPLTIIGSLPPSGIIGWLGVVIKGLFYAFVPWVSYPSVLVLELGIDHPGDMDYLLEIVKPDVAVLTSIGVSHLENFESEEQLENEKGKLARAVKPDGLLVFNADDVKCVRQAESALCNKIGYGVSNGEVKLVRSDMVVGDDNGTELEIDTPQGSIAFTVGVIGQANIYALLAATAVGISLDQGLEDLSKNLSQYQPERGRLSLLKGKNETLIIDSTYNAAPSSVVSALNTLAVLPGKPKIAVLGDMLELGVKSGELHFEVGNEVAKLQIDYLVTLGEKAKLIADGAVDSGMDSTRVKSFDEIYSLVNFIDSVIEPGTVLLFKGSQGMRMEKVVREFLQDPSRAPELLCRQEPKWQ